MIGHTGFQMATRFLNVDKDEKKIPVLTLGAGSYICNASYENATPHTHILIGKYSSIAHAIRFVVALNHDYRRSTTYDFDHPEIYRQVKILCPDLPEKPFKPVSISEKEINPHQIVIGNDVWIGSHATIISGVHIGSGAVIGANAVVAKDIPPYAIAVGNPARVIKYRFDEETIKKFMAVKWWNWDLRKILENAPLMDNPKKFLEKHYSPELEKIPEENIQKKRGG